MPKGQPRNQFPALYEYRLAGTTCRSQLPGPTRLHQTHKAEGTCCCWEGITVRCCKILQAPVAVSKPQDWSMDWKYRETAWTLSTLIWSRQRQHGEGETKNGVLPVDSAMFWSQVPISAEPLVQVCRVHGGYSWELDAQIELILNHIELT